MFNNERKPRKIAIYGGAFDPPHLGHLAVAKDIFETELCDELWVVPALEHNFGKNMTDFQHRLNMCELTFLGEDNIKVSSIEQCIERKGKSTFELIVGIVSTLMTNGNIGTDISIVIGQDNAECIEKWENSEALLKLCNFIVLPRDRISSKDKWYTKAPHHFVNDFKQLNISSSEIRINVEETLDITEPTKEYIRRNQLYA